MEYRYALMPLLYSFKDISEVLKEKAYKYQTSRSKEDIDLTSSYNASGPGEFLYWESSGKLTVRSVTKGRFDLGDIQRLITLIGMNPFRTAWELIPLSFVVDWFFNIGDAITALTGIDYASERLGYTAIREQSVFTCKHHLAYHYEFHRAARINFCGQPLAAMDHVVDRIYDNVVMEVRRDMYTRTIWQRATPKIELNPFLNWKRFIDGLVLSYQPTKKILRSLK